ncbi:Putative uncharacterized protein [Moritella viscosa]|uniref:hypothetical protein n=1 Tax=Moritella viscosa TaxID=80854 RepID=UPI000509056F|nr:hypothetical protein [Moritella viscosa]CED61465.1 hypothetical protein, putative phage gene [Moritella viscosa]SHO05451.1 Putative uncharacterized protein [Moritella viscosa]SHO21424.1 Putative uncharacterized protein [Moritella viscosa]
MSNTPLIKIIEHTDIYHSSDVGLDIVNLQNASIQFPKSVRVSPIYFGCVLYKNYIIEDAPVSRVFGSPPLKQIIIKDDTILDGRVTFVRNFLDHISVSKNRDITHKVYLITLMEFTAWCIKRGYHDFVENEGATLRAYANWVNEVEIKIKSGVLNWSPVTAAGRQRDIIGLLTMRYGSDFRNKLIACSIIFKSKREAKSVRSLEDCRSVILHLKEIAYGLTDLVVGEKKFPFQMPYSGENVYIFPNDKGFVKTKNTTFLIQSYDYENGKVFTHKEVLKIPTKDRTVKLWTVRGSGRNLLANNNNKVSFTRMRFADIACRCYLEIFIILTGIHRTEVTQLEFMDTIETEKSQCSKDFRAIKFRAKGLETSYRVYKDGVSILKKYLTLRAWIKESVPEFKEQNSFFIKVVTPSGNRSDEPVFAAPIAGDDIGRVYKRIQGKFFPANFKVLTPREIRRVKTVILHELEQPVQAISDTMNHTVDTNLKVYANTRTSSQGDQLSTFWDSVKEASKQFKIIETQNAARNAAEIEERSISIGHCSEFNNPIQVSNEPLVEPDCKTQYGCLFCKNYCCHADEEDLHKLISLTFIVSSLRTKGLCLNEHQNFLDKLHLKVNSILHHVKATSSEALVVYESVYERVWELGELTPFWELRLRRYESMGVIF